MLERKVSPTTSGNFLHALASVKRAAAATRLRIPERNYYGIAFLKRVKYNYRQSVEISQRQHRLRRANV